MNNIGSYYNRLTFQSNSTIVYVTTHNCYKLKLPFPNVLFTIEFVIDNLYSLKPSGFS